MNATSKPLQSGKYLIGVSIERSTYYAIEPATGRLLVEQGYYLQSIEQLYTLTDFANVKDGVCDISQTRLLENGKLNPMAIRGIYIIKRYVDSKEETKGFQIAAIENGVVKTGKAKMSDMQTLIKFANYKLLNAKVAGETEDGQPIIQGITAPLDSQAIPQKQTNPPKAQADLNYVPLRQNEENTQAPRKPLNTEEVVAGAYGGNPPSGKTAKAKERDMYKQDYAKYYQNVYRKYASVLHGYGLLTLRSEKDRGLLYKSVRGVLGLSDFGKIIIRTGKELIKKELPATYETIKESIASVENYNPTDYDVKVLLTTVEDYFLTSLGSKRGKFYEIVKDKLGSQDYYGNIFTLINRCDRSLNVETPSIGIRAEWKSLFGAVSMAELESVKESIANWRRSTTKELYEAYDTSLEDSTSNLMYFVSELGVTLAGSKSTLKRKYKQEEAENNPNGNFGMHVGARYEQNLALYESLVLPTHGYIYDRENGKSIDWCTEDALHLLGIVQRPTSDLPEPYFLVGGWNKKFNGTTDVTSIVKALGLSATSATYKLLVVNFEETLKTHGAGLFKLYHALGVLKKKNLKHQEQEETVATRILLLIGAMSFTIDRDSISMTSLRELISVFNPEFNFITNSVVPFIEDINKLDTTVKTALKYLYTSGGLFTPATASTLNLHQMGYSPPNLILGQYALLPQELVTLFNKYTPLKLDVEQTLPYSVMLRIAETEKYETRGVNPFSRRALHFGGYIKEPLEETEKMPPSKISKASIKGRRRRKNKTQVCPTIFKTR